jgi:2-(1,2-epoxy-1,2-dihydrophenyl)acetyl-CoA isomerase
MNEAILIQRRGKVALIELNRPDAKNALNLSMRKALRVALDDVAAEASIRAVVLTGRGSAFCSGGDVKSAASGASSHPRNITWSLMHDVQPALETIGRMDKPVIAALNGPAVGFGMSLALSCDLMVMSDKAYLLSQFSKLGLIPDGGAAWYLARRVGSARMFEAILEAKKLDAATCLSWGISNRVVADDALVEEAMSWAAQLASHAPTAARLTKRLARLALSNRLEESLTLEAEFQSICTASADTREAISAFVEKRPARYED